MAIFNAAVLLQPGSLAGQGNSSNALTLLLVGLPALLGIVARLSATKPVAKFFIGGSLVLLGVTSGVGLLTSFFAATESLQPLLLINWALIGLLVGALSRRFSLSLLPIPAVVVLWFLYRESSFNIISLIQHLGVAIGPLLIGAMLPRQQSTDDDAAPKASSANKSKQLVAGSTDAIIKAMSEGVVTLDGQGIITLMNPAAEKITGWSKQDAIKLSYKSVIKLVDKTLKEVNESENPIAESMRSGTPIDSRKLLLETKSGKRIDLSIIITPVGNQEGGVIVVFRDITSEKAEENAQTEFISTASHEMRTPVASIEGYLGLALNPSTAQIDDKAREYITKAHESAQHLGRLFQDLLDITKADDGLLQNNPEPIDVTVVTRDIIEGLRHKAEEKSLELIYAPDITTRSNTPGIKRVNPSFFIQADKDHLREVISNLTDNAIKYTLEGSIRVDVTGDNEHVVISLTDTGIGIPKEDIGHLFQKFYRVDNSDTREIGGTGLGLYLVRRRVEAMGGRIWIESEYGQGSTFFVQLDRLDSVTAQQQIGALAIQQPGVAPSVSATNEPLVSNSPATASSPVENQVTPDSPAKLAINSQPASAAADPVTSTAEPQIQNTTPPELIRTPIATPPAAPVNQPSQSAPPATTAQPQAPASPATPASSTHQQPAPPATPQPAPQVQPPAQFKPGPQAIPQASATQPVASQSQPNASTPPPQANQAPGAATDLGQPSPPVNNSSQAPPHTGQG